MSGSVCLDVINQTWSPMFGTLHNTTICLFIPDLINIFEVFLPQLLTYPNPTDPMNGEAAALMLKEPEKFKTKVRDYVQRFAKELDKKQAEQDEDMQDADDSLSSVSDTDNNDLADFEL